MKKYEFLTNISLDDARQKMIDAVRAADIPVATEVVKVREANNCVTARAHYAVRSSPHYVASAMDGIAVLASKTVGATEGNPVRLTPDDYIVVDTGDPLPENTDAVVMIENVVEAEDGDVLLYSACVPWDNVRQVGEDICMGDMIVPSYTVMTPALIGAFMAAGVYEVEVVKRPVFGIIPTGDEIVDGDADLKPGDIPEFNSAIFSAMLSDWGADSIVYPVVKDKIDLLEAAVTKAADECDAVLTIAGSSAGRDDYTSTILTNLGELLVHGIAIKPGKPAVLGMIGKKPFCGMPGYPVSGIIVMEEIVKYVCALLTHREPERDETVKAQVSRKLTSSLKYEEFLRCRVAEVDGKNIAVPMPRGAGVVTGFAKAGGLFFVDQNSEGLEAGATVDVALQRDKVELENSLSITGSHDPLIDEAADLLIRQDERTYVVSSHVGSMGAIMALRAGETALGGIHLLDAESGEYNKAYVRQYFPNGGVTLIRCVIRQQGLMVKKGNPENIHSVKDLIGKRYVNRQKGAGTRILLDYLLEKEGMTPDDIYGYTREEYTHTAVAAAVADGGADAGMGIYSAAKTYGLDFVPLWDEEYDFLVRDSALETPEVQRFLAVLKSDEFAARLTEMGGYTLEAPGEVIPVFD